MIAASNDPNPNMRLVNYTRIYIEKAGIAKESGRQYFSSVRNLGDWHGSSIRLCELSDDLVDAWLRHLAEELLMPTTIRNRRSCIRALWHAAAQDNLCEPSIRNRLRAPAVERVRHRHEAAEQALGSYLLYKDLKPRTVEYYRRVIDAFAGWAAEDDESRQSFTPEVCSRFLRDKQVAGATPTISRACAAAFAPFCISSARGTRCGA